MKPLSADQIISVCELSLSGPGVWADSHASGGELDLARKLGARLHEQLKATVFLTTGLDGDMTPGFDGLVIDANKRPIANLSIKTTFQLKKTFLNNFKQSTRKTERLHAAEGWFKALVKRVESSTSTYETDFYARSSVRVDATFSRWTAIHAIWLQMFVSHPPRPLWLVVGAESSSSGVASLLNYTGRHPHLTVFLIHADKISVIHKNKLLDLNQFKRVEDILGIWNRDPSGPNQSLDQMTGTTPTTSPELATPQPID